ncbi:MAG: hypothetical protein KJ052_13665 [Candidatus Hydrogenedentes bacterium]|nr:hypothetical protein [Candidatus Hydrogenedentota bacterium]
MTQLREIAHGRSGDKGGSANVGIIAYTQAGYDYLKKELTAEVVKDFFKPLGVTNVTRYELPNLLAFNFVLKDVLAGGGSRSIRIDAQGKTLAQALLQMELNGDSHHLFRNK